MTWLWDIEGEGTDEQTLVVISPDGEQIGSENRESWTWSGSYPSAVTNLMPETISAMMAIQRNDIERRDGDT